MLPHYAERNLGAEVAIWLLITVGALLVPIIVIAICCIRRHLAKKPIVKLIERPPRRMSTTMTKPVEVPRSYNGPYTESGHDDGCISSGSNLTSPSFSRTNSLKKQHVHWPDGSTTPKLEPPAYSEEMIVKTTELHESPSMHRPMTIIPSSSSALSHVIQTAIIPAGSTSGGSAGANQFISPSKPSTSTLAGYDSIV